MPIPPEHASKEKSTKLLILPSLRTIYNRTFQCETPCTLEKFKFKLKKLLGFRNLRKSQKRKKDIKTTLVQKPNILRKKVRKRKWMQNFIIFISFLIYFFLLKVAIQNDEKKEKNVYLFPAILVFYISYQIGVSYQINVVLGKYI